MEHLRDFVNKDIYTNTSGVRYVSDPPRLLFLPFRPTDETLRDRPPDRPPRPFLCVYSVDSVFILSLGFRLMSFAHSRFTTVFRTPSKRPPPSRRRLKLLFLLKPAVFPSIGPLPHRTCYSTSVSRPHRRISPFTEGRYL